MRLFGRLGLEKITLLKVRHCIKMHAFRSCSTKQTPALGRIAINTTIFTIIFVMIAAVCQKFYFLRVSDCQRVVWGPVTLWINDCSQGLSLGIHRVANKRGHFLQVRPISQLLKIT